MSRIDPPPRANPKGKNRLIRCQKKAQNVRVKVFLLYSVILTGLTFFWQNMGLTAGGFPWKSWKNDIRPNCFWETGRIFIKYGLENSVFFWEWLLTNYSDRWFVRKNRKKKVILQTFLTRNIKWFWQIRRFVWSKWAWRQVKSEKKKAS